MTKNIAYRNMSGMSDKKPVWTRLTIEKGVLAKLRAAAEREGLTANQYLDAHLSPTPFLSGEFLASLQQPVGMTESNEQRVPDFLKRGQLGGMFPKYDEENQNRVKRENRELLWSYDTEYEHRFFVGEEKVWIDARVKGLNRWKHEKWVLEHLDEIREYYRQHCPMGTMGHFRLKQGVLKRILTQSTVYVRLQKTKLGGLK